MRIQYVPLPNGEWLVEASIRSGALNSAYVTRVNKERGVASWEAVSGCARAINLWGNRMKFRVVKG